MQGRHERLAEMLGLLRRPGEPRSALTRRENVWIGLGLLVVVALVVTGLLVGGPAGLLVQVVAFGLLIGLNVWIQRIRRGRTDPSPD